MSILIITKFLQLRHIIVKYILIQKKVTKLIIKKEKNLPHKKFFYIFLKYSPIFII